MAMIMILSVAILILVAYIFSQNSEIKSLKTRISRLNKELDDTCRAFNRFSAEIEDLKEANATLTVQLSDLHAEQKSHRIKKTKGGPIGPTGSSMRNL